MTLADQLREEGEFKKEREIILSLLENGMKEKEVAEKTGIDLERIFQIEKEMKN